MVGHKTIIQCAASIICVDENARGQHVGRSLYEYVRGYAQSIGCNNITLNVWNGNEPAWRFYNSMGMQVQKTTMEVILNESQRNSGNS